MAARDVKGAAILRRDSGFAAERRRQLFQNRVLSTFNALQAAEDCLSTSKYVENGNTTGEDHR